MTQKHINTNVGIVENYNENAINTSGANIGGMSVKAQSRARLWWDCSIRPFLENFRSVKEQIVAVTDLGGGNYTVEVASAGTSYLEDTVSILGEKYTVSNVTDTTFDIVASEEEADLMTGAYATWSPFESLQVGCINVGSF